MALVREHVYSVSVTHEATSVAAVNGNLYVGTSDTGIPTTGVLEIVSQANPASHGLYENTSGVDDPEYVTVYNGKLYVTQFRSSAANNIYQVDVGSGIALFATTTIQPYAVMFRADGSFWVTNFSTTIERRSAAGAFVGNITAPASVGSGTFYGGSCYLPSFVVDDIFVVDESTLAVTALSMSTDSVGETLEVVGDRIYWTDRNLSPVGNIWSSALDGSDQTLEYTNTDWEPLFVRHIGGYLYVVDATSDASVVYRFAVGGGRWTLGRVGCSG